MGDERVGKARAEGGIGGCVIKVMDGGRKVSATGRLGDSMAEELVLILGERGLGGITEFADWCVKRAMEDGTRQAILRRMKKGQVRGFVSEMSMGGEFETVRRFLREVA